ncbi:hypothetical protein BX600DRAFT_511224 [Xylariales sp. PMI_506]|nr:hypothetical protein BX600DRAFT_511224 [Xylariales sp. PMI_506]
MSDAGEKAASTESPSASKAHAPKDRNCPYCGQAFTSSSLGRHLDLYIKDKNPKPPDGVHDVDEIRKLRAGITRRQPRGSLAGRRDASTPSTPTGSNTARKSPDAAKLSSVPTDSQYAVNQGPAVYPWQQPTWEATGVINDLPGKISDANSGGWDEAQGDQSRRLSAQHRVPSRTTQKQQLDARQKLTDAVDTARAAELALRELLSSFRAAKQQIDMNSVPFDFDPLALDFPALTLQCLQPPPTLFSSTPHPTSTSWSIQPPAQKQYDALCTFFQEEFRKWRVTCAAATTALSEELNYPPSQTQRPVDAKENVKKAEKTAAALEKQVNEHLQSTYQVWEQLPASRQQELWTLELARGIGRRQKELESVKEMQHSFKQENANLKSQIDQLNRLQQPREFRIMTPGTIPFDQSFVSYLLEQGVTKGQQAVALNTDDRHVDLNTLVGRAIERWKKVIVSSRVSGMSAQRPLEQTPTVPAPAPTSGNTSSAPESNHATPTPAVPPQPKAPSHQQAQPRQVSTTTTGAPKVSHTATVAATTTSTATASPSVAHEDNSDEDADAEMEDDDSFAPLATQVIANASEQQQQQPQHMQKLQIPRTREHAQRNNAQFAINGTAGTVGGSGRGAMSSIGSRPLANMNHMQAQVPQRAQTAVMKTDYTTVVSNGDPMYMD